MQAQTRSIPNDISLPRLLKFKTRPYFKIAKCLWPIKNCRKNVLNVQLFISFPANMSQELYFKTGLVVFHVQLGKKTHFNPNGLALRLTSKRIVELGCSIEPSYFWKVHILSKERDGIFLTTKDLEMLNLNASCYSQA